nr:CCR4-NOT transcription complex subunit 1 [Ipomoea batatas]
MAKGITFRNTAGRNSNQAVAFSATSDKGVLYQCAFEGYQDTLYLGGGRQFVRDCNVYGTVDFIFGYDRVIFQNTNIYVRKPPSNVNVIVAHDQKKPFVKSGFIFQNCTIKADPELCFLDTLIDPAGWIPWDSSNQGLDTLYYGEYSNTGPGANTANRVLAVTVKFIQRDSDEKADSFDPRPYFRLFINWIIDLCSSDSIFDGANFQILTLFASAFHALQPLKCQGSGVAFSFVWLELVTHRCFMPKLLTGNAQNGWPYFHRLLVDLLQFMEPILRNAELGEAPVCLLYEETLRVLLIILNDFPEFLCDYHFSFCDVIPPICIQMRNMVLSACPRNMNLPNPSAPGVKVIYSTEIPYYNPSEFKLSPRILSEVDAALKTRQLKHDVDEYLKTRQQGSLFLRELKQTLLLSPSEAARAGTHYNVPLINSLVLYVGILLDLHHSGMWRLLVRQVGHDKVDALHQAASPAGRRCRSRS